MSDRLVGAHRQTALKELHGWSEVLERDAIRKTFHFADFPAAWGFMNQVALLAEKTGHHPEWFNDLGRVEVILYTRSADAVTQSDIDFAHRLDQMAPLHDR
ncbi:4a-hydroxytetrahydrobiopterin dehydratase [Azospirillum sp. B21]|uniref:4a-hydroxytetrahydrobiopterin dehydratase n=1 Tax=Azospirillum sp. B21 TaxID=2607496 RepID=UPI0011EEB2CD|nr:4a-hydroxytetrahydrobiopterin dehydratase [Azospirillum sp. B21]KAA0580364.1 4a-hydroxytetrahydrobiopterin dehydratase [Azospirillum sp. B21]